VLNFLIDNLLPVTIGNLIGGTVMVSAVYWLSRSGGYLGGPGGSEKTGTRSPGRR